MSFKTDSLIEQTALSIRVEIGTQAFSSEIFFIVIFGCGPLITLPKLEKAYRYQVDAEIPVIQTKVLSDSVKCEIKSYKLNDTI